MQSATIEQELSAISDLPTRRHRWLELIQIASAPSPTDPTSRHNPDDNAFLWRYPLTLPDLEPHLQSEWQREAQARLNLHEYYQSDLKTASDLQKRKLACKSRIQKAWGIKVENILAGYLNVGAGGLGRSSLEVLATIAEESRFNEAETVLKEVVRERVATQPHVGKSRNQKITRYDIMETRIRLQQRDRNSQDEEKNTLNLANVTGRQKRKGARSTLSAEAQPKDRQKFIAPSAGPPTPATSLGPDSSRSADERDMTSEVGIVCHLWSELMTTAEPRNAPISTKESTRF